jgi:uncharacterized Zn-binding protein involved in type VI secretion
MKRAAAKQGDRISGTDTHIVMVPGSPPAPTPLPHPFMGIVGGASLSQNVNIMKRPAAIVGSEADNMPHLPTSPGVSFQRPPGNKAKISRGSATVFINGKPVARDGDPGATCDDPADTPAGTVLALGTVMVG